ncbi:hypothetical protein ACIOEX_08235 [Streptomyces sp. NPDC087850]|uniref:hypothetical protein n=1 Tax=Streptomyces sp. NPDC087850 TaxID=3365809 RepID=UPI003811D888
MTVPPADNGPSARRDDTPHVPRQTAPAPPPQGPPEPYTPQLAEEENAATRYMCTGVRLSEDFARLVMSETRHERIRARAPSYGVDLDHVRAHAAEALRDLRVRDRRVGAAFLLSLLLAPSATVLYALAAAAMNAAAGENMRVRGVRRTKTAGRVWLTKPQGSPFAAVAAPLATQNLLLGLACWSGQFFLWSLPDLFAAFALSAVLLIGCPWYFTWRQHDAAWQVIRDSLRPGPAFQRSGRPTPADDTNLVVYTGYSPFVGSGGKFSSWSFATRLIPKGMTPGSGTKPPPVPFGSSALIDRLRADLLELRAESTASADGIAGMEVTEKVFVHGTALRNTKLLRTADIWPGGALRGPGKRRPTERLPQDRVTALRGRIDGPVRHCLSLQIRSWDTDLVLTVFVQISVNGGTLYLQSDTHVLPPVKEAFRVADSLTARESSEEAIRRGADAALASGGVLLRSVPHVIAELGEAGRLKRREEEQQWALQHDKRYDFGALTSLRELIAAGQYRNFFQFVDATRTGKQIELQVLRSVMDFLADHGLDVHDLDARRTTILNNGVMMYGGSMTGSIAAGQGASATATGLAGGGGPAGAGAGAGAGTATA